MAVICFAVIPMAAQNVKKVAVWETKCTDGSINKFQSTMVRGGMEAAVANAEGYTGYDRTAFDAIIKEQNFQRSGAVSDNDIKRMGEMAGVQYIIVPEAMASGNDFYIIVKMLNVESGEYGAAYEELCTTSSSDIKNACEKLGAQLFGSAKKNNDIENNSKSNDILTKNELKRAGFRFLKDKVSKSINIITENGIICEIKNAFYYNAVPTILRCYGGTVSPQGVLNGFVILESDNGYNYLAYICEGWMTYPLIEVRRGDIFIGLEEGSCSYGCYYKKWDSYSDRSTCQALINIFGDYFTEYLTSYTIPRIQDHSLDLINFEMLLMQFVKSGKKMPDEWECDDNHKLYFE